MINTLDIEKYLLQVVPSEMPKSFGVEALKVQAVAARTYAVSDILKGKYANAYIDGIFYSEGKIANWWCDDGTDWYFFKDGKKYTGKAVDGNGEMYFIKGKYANTYIDGIFYSKGKIANWWCDDGNAWYFFQNGKKHNGYGVDANGKRYFVDGKYANGIYGGKLYKDGIESKGRTYVNGIFYHSFSLSFMISNK